MAGNEYLMPPDTPALKAVRALRQWIDEHPDPANEGGLKASRDDPGVVVVYWRGAPPAGLRKLAARQPVPVIFFQAAYSWRELAAVAESLAENNPGVVSSAGTRPECAGVLVTLATKAPPNALAELERTCPVPIVFMGFVDPMPLGRNAG